MLCVFCSCSAWSCVMYEKIIMASQMTVNMNLFTSLGSGYRY